MRYEAGDCAIIISIMELSNDVLMFNLSHIFEKCSKPNSTNSRMECSIHADHNGANPSFISRS